MKRKLLSLFITLFAVMMSLSIATACSTPQDPPGDWGSGIEITGVSFSSLSFDYDSTEKSIVVAGELPSGVTVSYQNNKGINAGVYNATATLNGDGYKELKLYATLTINKISYDMSKVSWNYSSPFTYDGNQKTIELSGLPNGVTINQYSNNQKTNAGYYTATATFNYDSTNYNQPSVSNCEWIINKADIIGVSVEENQSIKQDGENHLPEIQGNIPNGVTTKYFIDGTETTGIKTLGTHNFRIVLSGSNYNEKTFTCTYKIKLDLSNLANTVISTFGSVPSPWSFFPESFSPENKTITQTPDFSNFYSVSSIPKNGIGKQLSVAYGLLNKTTVALSYVQPIYAVLNTIKTVYSNFLDSSPEEYTSFSSTIAGITFGIELTETQYCLYATVNSVQVLIYSDVENNTYGAKIQLTPTTILKYTVSEDSLLVAMDILDFSATQIEFVRNDNEVLGYMYEYIVAGDKPLVATSTLIHSDENYTTLIGTKGDFIPTATSRNCEVYSSVTGNLVGTEVREELTIAGRTAIYNTLWYTLDDIQGIYNIKKVDEQNALNADTIYINNAAESIHSKIVGGNIIKDEKFSSRRFDIEFKKMYFYVYDQASAEYTQVACEIPMIFVQEENFDTFTEDFSNANGDFLTGEIALLASSSDKKAVEFGYYTLLEDYEKIKDAVTVESITNYCKK